MGQGYELRSRCPRRGSGPPSSRRRSPVPRAARARVRSSFRAVADRARQPAGDCGRAGAEDPRAAEAGGAVRSRRRACAPTTRCFASVWSSSPSRRLSTTAASSARQPIPGPAIVLQVDSTTVVPPHCTAEVDRIRIHHPQAAACAARQLSSSNRSNGSDGSACHEIDDRTGPDRGRAASAPARVIAQQSALEEIVVTATRREERLQDVASSATVFSGEDLQALRVLEPRDLAEQTPGLLAKYGPNGLATVGFYMRGVGSTTSPARSTPRSASTSTRCSSRRPTCSTSLSTTSRASRCCAARRARSTGATAPAARSTSSRPGRPRNSRASRAPGTAATTRSRRPAP